MNEFYVSRWKQVRHIEGASQRIQEDTMRFAAIMEGLGVAFVDSIMTLIAFPTSTCSIISTCRDITNTWGNTISIGHTLNRMVNFWYINITICWNKVTWARV